MLNSKSIGNKIADARKKSNLSQSDLAQQVSISPQAVGKWERGESMPDITTLNRLAEIFGLDLNYFSDSFSKPEAESTSAQKIHEPSSGPEPKKRFEGNWDMSEGNWVDADFSGLKNIKERFSASNMKNCQFRGSDLSGLTLKANNIEICDFSASDMRNSKIQSSELSKNLFVECSLVDTEFSNSEIIHCNFNHANLSGAEFLNCNFYKNSIEKSVWKHSSFKNTDINEVIFEGTIEDCSFDNCSFKNVKFQNATLTNTFFKHNRKLNRVQFIDCKVDALTYAFLKSGKANLEGISLFR